MEGRRCSFSMAMVSSSSSLHTLLFIFLLQLVLPAICEAKKKGKTGNTGLITASVSRKRRKLMYPNIDPNAYLSLSPLSLLSSPLSVLPFPFAGLWRSSCIWSQRLCRVLLLSCDLSGWNKLVQVISSKPAQKKCVRSRAKRKKEERGERSEEREARREERGGRVDFRTSIYSHQIKTIEFRPFSVRSSLTIYGQREQVLSLSFSLYFSLSLLHTFYIFPPSLPPSLQISLHQMNTKFLLKRKSMT